MTKSYKVTITNPNLSGESAGFIDPVRITMHGTAEYTVAQALDKKRANLRYAFVIVGVGMVVNPEVKSIVCEATPTSEAPSISMDMTVASEEHLFIRVGDQDYTGVDALKYIIADSLSYARTLNTDVYDPVKIATVAPITIGGLGTVDEISALITITPL